LRNLKVPGAIALLCAIVPLRAENLFHHKKEIAVVALHMTDAITTHEGFANPSVKSTRWLLNPVHGVRRLAFAQL
jgi:hypothetical protein